MSSESSATCSSSVCACFTVQEDTTTVSVPIENRPFKLTGPSGNRDESASCSASTQEVTGEQTIRSIGDRCEKGDHRCCREVRKKERKLISSDVVRDIIIGLSDGLTVPFALTAGLSSLGSARLVYTGGLAELISGAISMGIGGYLASKAEQDTFYHLYRTITDRVETSCHSEVDREVNDILGPFGVTQDLSCSVARSLDRAGKISGEDVHSTSISQLEKVGFRKPKIPTKGTVPFLLKFGESVQMIPTRRQYLSALTIGSAYFVGGLLPIIPYFCVGDALHGLYWSIVRKLCLRVSLTQTENLPKLVTAVILIVFGIVKAHLTGAASDLKGLAWGAISTLLVGATAAAASYGIVRAVEGDSKLSA